MGRLSNLSMFRAFRSRNYSLYFFGRAVSQFGTWMQRAAVVWVIYTITHRAGWIGITICAEQLPSFLFSFWGGVAADRYNRYKVIQITQVASIVQALLLAVLVATGHTTVWAILVLSVVLGIINAFDVPARQSLLNETVADPSDLPNAISLTTATAGMAQMAGTALSGIIINAFGAAICFFFNAASFGGVMLSLMLMKIDWNKQKKSGKKVLDDFVEGIRYVTQTPNIGLLMLMLTVVSLLVMPYNTVIPVFAKVIFKGDARTFGYITGFISAGGIAGTIFLASRKSGSPLKRILFVCTILLGIGLICFAVFKSFAPAMIFAALSGFGAMAEYTVCNIIVQSESAPEMRGRAIGIMLMVMFGMVPLGSVVAGFVADRIGAPATMLTEGIIAIIIALVFTKFLVQSPQKPAINDIETGETGEDITERR